MSGIGPLLPTFMAITWSHPQTEPSPGFLQQLFPVVTSSDLAPLWSILSTADSPILLKCKSDSVSFSDLAWLPFSFNVLPDLPLPLASSPPLFSPPDPLHPSHRP